eukprot:3778680-Pyramimonas_sp.AAC.1
MAEHHALFLALDHSEPGHELTRPLFADCASLLLFQRNFRKAIGGGGAAAERWGAHRNCV